jgi:hypothetical protein
MTSTLPESYTLIPADLLDKWGFADGDLLFEVADWLRITENLDLDDHDLLAAVVHRFLLPALSLKESDTEEFITVHNPILLRDSLRTMLAQVRIRRGKPVIVPTFAILALARTLPKKEMPHA